MSRAPPSLVLEHLRIRDFRNIAALDLQFARRVNVISGNNGHGKTSILEAVYFVATSRSFRSTRPAELIRHGERTATVVARFAEVDAEDCSIERQQGASVRARNTIVQINEKRPRTLVEYATRSPVVAFHAGELGLSSGPAGGRRTLLDRLALFMSPTAAAHRSRYTRAIRSRQRLLHGERGGPPDLPAVEAFEDLCATHGAALTIARSHAALALAVELSAAFTEMAAPGLSLSALYVPGGSPDPEEARAQLRSHRSRDGHRPTAGFGPHRDDLELLLDGHPARLTASQGQHRILTLALKAAEATAIATARGVTPLLLLDDVSSELDPERTTALFDFLARTKGQIFLTTTRPELIVTPGVDVSDRRDFWVECGQLRASRDAPNGAS